MVAIFPTTRVSESMHRLLYHWREILTLLLCLAVAAALASTYVGSSPSPYGNCFGTTGRPVPCEIAPPRR